MTSYQTNSSSLISIYISLFVSKYVTEMNSLTINQPNERSLAISFFALKKSSEFYFCLYNQKFNRLCGHLGELVIVFVGKTFPDATSLYIWFVGPVAMTLAVFPSGTAAFYFWWILELTYWLKACFSLLNILWILTYGIRGEIQSTRSDWWATNVIIHSLTFVFFWPLYVNDTSAWILM